MASSHLPDQVHPAHGDPGLVSTETLNTDLLCLVPPVVGAGQAGSGCQEAESSCGAASHPTMHPGVAGPVACATTKAAPCTWAVVDPSAQPKAEEVSLQINTLELRKQT